MSNVSPLQRPFEDERSTEDSPPEPKLFVRAITTPPGLPWDQARAAGLEARVGAPLPLAQVLHQLKRLEPWSAGKNGRYAVAYVRTDQVKGQLRATGEVDGRRVPFVFLSPREHERRLRSLLIVGSAAALSTTLVVIGVGTALQARARAETSLANLEHVVAVRGREVTAQELRKQEARALDEEGVSGRRMGDFLNDLAWASNAKAPDARIQALHWDRGYLAVEARGDAAPFLATDRHVERAPKPVKRGVWLWGVSSRSAQ